MTERRTATTNMVSQVNLAAITETLLERGPLSRKQIGAFTGLSPATVNRLTAQLLEHGVIVRAGLEPSDGGRPSHLLRYAGETRLAGAVKVNGATVTGILMDLTGRILHRYAVETGPRGEDRLEACLAAAEALPAEAARRGKPFLALGASIPGFVRAGDGAVLQAAELGWNDVPLGRLIADRLNEPVLVENDANAIAYAEWARGAGRGSKTLAAIELGAGIGAGIVSEGRLHRGARSVAGEIGFLLTGTSALSLEFGDVGDLESRLGARALEDRAGRSGWTPESGPVCPWIIRQARAEPEAAVKRLAHDLFDHVALGISALSSVLDPDLVVLCGG
ncbi:hypothetical protein GCM10029992_05470 [Glycomyces albus]